MEGLIGKITGLPIIVSKWLKTDCRLIDEGLLISKQKSIELREHFSKDKPLSVLFEAKLLMALYKYKRGGLDGK